MPKECERKFLVTSTNWLQQYPFAYCHQGYLSIQKERTVRIRVIDNAAFITVKGLSVGGVCPEFEYPIPTQHAQEMLTTLALQPTIEKYRYTIPFAQELWVVDVFLGQNNGLVLAEVELEDIDKQIIIPPWAGQEVTGNPQYFNANLINNPFCQW